MLFRSGGELGTSQTIIVNGLEGNGDNVINTFGKITPQNTTYKISSFAIQGYYNSLDIQRLLGDGTINGWKYTPPPHAPVADPARPQEFVESRIVKEFGTDNKVYTIKDALDKLYKWTTVLDGSIIKILATTNESDKDIKEIYAWLGKDFFKENKAPGPGETVTERLQDLSNKLKEAVTKERERAEGKEKEEAKARADKDNEIIKCLGTDYYIDGILQFGKDNISTRLNNIETFKGNISSGLTLDTQNNNKLKSPVNFTTNEDTYLVTNDKLKNILNKVIENENEILPEYSKIMAGYNKLLVFFKAQSIVTDSTKIRITRTRATKEHNIVDVFLLGSNNFSNYKVVGDYNGIEYCKLTFRDDTFGIQWDDVYVPKIGNISETVNKDDYSYITAKYKVTIGNYIG